jgi:hypothetical protein
MKLHWIVIHKLLSKPGYDGPFFVSNSTNYPILEVLNSVLPKLGMKSKGRIKTSAQVKKEMGNQTDFLA